MIASVTNASGTLLKTHASKNPIYVQSTIKNYRNLGPRLRTYKMVRNVRVTLLASEINYYDEQKYVFDGERCTKAFVKTYGHCWARVLSQQGFKGAQDYLLG